MVGANYYLPLVDLFVAQACGLIQKWQSHSTGLHSSIK